ncbi:MAG: DUF4369 domain-containing protein [Prevotella sp.]|uniref:DUF4369 domain-containing protein n=1 Tax=Prevotella sp. TaxID=59823 RepID=UPI002A2E4C54|nr:DUF4369 domain-containing protein [Prevotella sp.]MDD7317483.1 DUF4369 domain-containing protein [Prevotellaceae bacterium]MDY4019181.1 DUF4369 domain-containing protein [Prevotella sp.]
MNKILYALIATALLASCANSYNITGTSSVQMLDGKKLYLKSVRNSRKENIDSCDVVHGQFRFYGTLDSITIVNLFIDDVYVTPLVLESGDITVKIDNSQTTVGGTELNSRLDNFMKSFFRLQDMVMEVEHEQNQGIMEGYDEAETMQRLYAKLISLSERKDTLFTNVVTNNFENVIGPWAFVYRVSYEIDPYNYPYPSWMTNVLYTRAMQGLPSWIEYIMAKAPVEFKQDAEVAGLYKAFQEQQNMVGGDDGAAPPVENNVLPVAPTPNDLARPALPEGDKQ